MKRGLANKILQQGCGLKKTQDHEPLGSSNVNMLIYLVLFGAICPATGATEAAEAAEAIVTPYVNKEAMRQHLKQISQATPTGRHAVVIMDGAGWHTDDTAFAFDNITLVRLPAYSPE